MGRILSRLVFTAAIAAQLGCSTGQLGPWGGPSYDYDLGKVGTGQSIFSPTNDAQYWNGEAMNQRGKR